jgi:hypothetical protein
MFRPKNCQTQLLGCLPRKISARAIVSPPQSRPASRGYIWVRHRLSAPRPAQWYRLFGGPNNLRELARAVDREGTYEGLYGEWSILGHAKDALLRHLVEGQSGGPAVRPIRNPETIPQTVSHAVSFALEVTRLMIEKYRPDERTRYGEWYVKDVRRLRWTQLSKHRSADLKVQNPAPRLTVIHELPLVVLT